MSRRTRRQFFEESLFASAAAIVAASAGSLCGADTAASSGEGRQAGPNDILRAAVIGVNGRGNDHIKGFQSLKKDVEITCICDADAKVGENRCEEIAKKTGKKPKFIQDVRKLFEDKDIDLVSTATPNHWHALIAIWAMQHGKDVYVEKPVSHNVSEGARIVETARHYKKICQAGTQSRSQEGMRQAIQYIHDGHIGEVNLARGVCYKPRASIGPRGVYEIPGSVNADLWYGPAPITKLTRPKFHYDWHWQWDYGCGDLGNQGIHQMDIARWGLGLDSLSSNVISYGGRYGYQDAGETPNTQVIVHDFGKKSLVFEVRGLKTQHLSINGTETAAAGGKESKAPKDNAGVGVIFYGSEGYVVCPSYEEGVVFDKDGKHVKTFAKGGDHYANFLKGVRSRNIADLHGEIQEGHLSSALCHTGNISYRLGTPVKPGEAIERLKDLKIKNEDVAATFDRVTKHLADNKASPESVQLGTWLTMDPKAETFVGNAAADAMLTREYRAPYVVPAKGKV